MQVCGFARPRNPVQRGKNIHTYIHTYVQYIHMYVLIVSHFSVSRIQRTKSSTARTTVTGLAIGIVAQNLAFDSMIHQRSHLSGLSDFEVRVQETGDYASASAAAGTRTATTAYAQLVFHHEDTAEPEPELKQHTTAPWKV